MRKSIIIFYFLIAINTFSQEKELNSTRYSMISLIANPEKYDGKWVSTTGFLKYIEGEEIRLFLSKDDLYYDNMKNCFVLYLDKSKVNENDLSYYNGHYVRLIGYFNNINHYYYGGAIENISGIISRDDIKAEEKVIEIEQRKTR
ncbi:hypothetical protein [Flavobacterium sp.]|uniref:hypothetical protein n=1 Tax=Flavobacterium sp. TaxID=239 RepID=UPI0040484948